MTSALQLSQLGVNIILSLLEEFTKKSSADLGVHGLIYLQRKIDFETTLLPHLFRLLMEEYHKQMDRTFQYTAFLEKTPSPSLNNSPMMSSHPPSNSSDLALAIGAGEELLTSLLVLLLKALTEMITWEYGETTHKGPHHGDIEGGKEGSNLLFLISKPPQQFHDFLIQLPFLDKSFHFYSKLRLMLEDIKKQSTQYSRSHKTAATAQHKTTAPAISPTGLVIMNHNTSALQQSFHQRREKLNNCLLELRNLFLALSLMTGDIFSSPDEKLSFGNALLSHAYQVAQPFLYRNQLSLLTFDATDYAEGHVRYDELLFFLQLISHFFNNYLLQTCMTMTSFPVFLDFISSIAIEICKELSLLTNDMTVKLVRSNYQDVTSSSYESNILQTWRFDLLFQVLEIFIMIHDDFLLSSSVSFPALNAPPPENAIAMLQQKSMEKLLITSSLKHFLFNFSKEVFPELFEIMMVIFVNDSLSSAEEEENEDEERINSRNLDTFFMGLSSLGRFAVFNSLQFLGGYLSNTFTDYQGISKLFDQASSSSSSPIDHSLEMKTLFCLEKIRLCILILSFLLIDNFSLGQGNGNGSGGGATSLNSKYSVFKSSASEVNMINDWILDAMKSDQLLTLQMVVECFRCVSIIYQFIITLLGQQKTRPSQELRNPCVSPYLLQTILYFYSEIFQQYLAPNVADYSPETLQHYPFVPTLFRDGKTHELLANPSQR